MFVDDLRILDECIRYIRNEDKQENFNSSSRRESLRMDHKTDSSDLFKLMGTSPAAPDVLLNTPIGRDEIIVRPMETKDWRDENDEEDVMSEISENRPRAVIRKGPLSFSRAPILPIEMHNRPLVSGLSMVLSESKNSHHTGTPSESLTIYLPNKDVLNVAVSSSQKIGEIIKKVLAVHQSENIQPPLLYKVHCYELRIHDMDGEPDEDFPPLDPAQDLHHYGVQLNEYCLCQINGTLEYDPVVAGRTSSDVPRRASIERTDLATMNGLSISVELAGANSSFKLNRVQESATVGDLIPLIAKHFRLSLYTDQYVFLISEEEQARLMLMSPILDMSWSLSKLGVKDFKLQRKVFADVPVPPPSVGLNEKNSSTNELKPGGNLSRRSQEDLYGLQEWSVTMISKASLSRSSRKSEVFIAIDRNSITVYNKFNSRSGMQQTITFQRVFRNLVSIETTEAKSSLAKTFKFVWKSSSLNDGSVFQCNTSQECGQIIAKVRGIMEQGI